MDIRIVDDFEPYLGQISKYFRNFYEREPWGDYKGCDPCFGELSLEVAPRFKPTDTHCPKCGNALGAFWSESRCRNALKNNNLFVGAFDKDIIKGWIIAKPVSDKTIAIDYMGLDASLRRQNESKLQLFWNFLFMRYYLLIKKYLPKYRDWANQKLGALPFVSLKLYCFFEDACRDSGFSTIQSTTHQDAKNIHNALRNGGFSLTQNNLENNRVLFVKKL